MTSRVALYVDGAEYSGWKQVRVTRGLLRATSDFTLTVSERWGLEESVWQILPGAACEVRYGNTLLLTGWVDAYRPSYDSKSHNIQLTGRSKTCDFVDSSVLVDGGQFKGMTVGQIAKLLAEPYKITVKVLDDGEPEAEVQVQQGETCFALVERLSRLQALLVTDDADGNLIITRAGTGRATGALRHGKNILTASANLDHSKRFSEVLVKAQRPGNDNKSNDDALAGWKPTTPPLALYRHTAARIAAIPNVGERHRERMVWQRTTGAKKGNPKSLTEVHGSAKDPDIKRYRPLVIVAEAQSDDGLAEKRADWEVRRRMAQGTEATISVNGWLQEDGGELWTTNQMVPVAAPWLGLERELVISEATYSYDDGGEITSLTLTLPDAFLPEEKRKAKKEKKAGGEGGGAAADPWKDWKPTGTSVT
jgi:prophage tail gpP-like protein